ncbi:MAG: PTS sugar transporter subunit IIC [Elusimicrobiota bacterium]|nr:PTS sugar transporter subunit IIC [Elusimicrobiota bacterium]
MTVLSVLVVSFFGAIFSADSTVVGQVMISRPIFCGPIIGLLLGDIEVGLKVGMIMELIWITVVPMGVSLPPDSAIVTVIATYLAARFSPETGGNGYLVFYLLLIIPVGIIFKKLDIIHRKYNSIFVSRMEQKIDEKNFSYINKATYLSALFFLLKAFFFLVIIIIASSLILPCFYGIVPGNVRESLNILFYILPAVGLGTAMTTFFFKKSRGTVQ